MTLKTINLKDYLNKKVTVTLSNGVKYNVTVKKHMGDSLYSLRCGETFHHICGYKSDGSNFLYSNKNIIHIEEHQMNCTEQLEQQIRKTQEELTKLQKQLEKVKKEEKMSAKFYTPILDSGEYGHTLKFLKTGDLDHLEYGFQWLETPQGEAYWQDRRFDKIPFSEEDYNQIRKWVVNYDIKIKLGLPEA